MNPNFPDGLSDKRDKIEKRLEFLKIPVSTMGVRG